MMKVCPGMFPGHNRTSFPIVQHLPKTPFYPEGREKNLLPVNLFSACVLG